MRAGSRPSGSAGGTALTLLSSALNLEVLRALGGGRQPLQELMRGLGFPPRSTLRLYLRTLTELGVVARLARNEFPSSVDYEITAAGRRLLEVSATLQAWLDRSPAAPAPLGSTAATSAVRALVEGWDSRIVRALATRPLSLTELDSLIPRLSYPSLERRLTAMRQAGLLRMAPTAGRSSPYEVTGLLRSAVAPLVAAIDWERSHAPQLTADLNRFDVEAMFLLVLPLAELVGRRSGRCRLAVEVRDAPPAAVAGVTVAVEEGRVVGCSSNLDGEVDAWARGKAPVWLRLLGGAAEELEVGGDLRLIRELVDAISRTASRPH